MLSIEVNAPKKIKIKREPHSMKKMSSRNLVYSVLAIALTSSYLYVQSQAKRLNPQPQVANDQQSILDSPESPKRAATDESRGNMVRLNKQGPGDEFADSHHASLKPSITPSLSPKTRTVP